MDNLLRAEDTIDRQESQIRVYGEDSSRSNPVADKDMQIQNLKQII